eukprot:TRINITY_DN4891_c0_g1_i1.p1 TRINITY_DN4891_c0_g1~~TRINITY_DN4891_c0_g1_i1.p1  ORF type:complete len:551 (+),score=152.53 TRINITY_DN4891_c0_g1_i1:28-1653(+)
MEDVVVVPTYGKHTAGPVVVRRTAGITTKAAFYSTACDVVESLSRVVNRCLGPDGIMRATMDMTGNVGFVSSGSRLLSKVRSTHPVTTYVLQSLSRYERERGDGSTTWVVLLNLLMHNLRDKEVPFREISSFRSRVPDAVDSAIAQHTKHLPVDTVVHNTVEGLVSTCCTGQASDIIINIVVKYFKMKGRIEGDWNVVRVEGAPLAQSCVLSGIVFKGSPKHPQLPKAVANTRAILLSHHSLFCNTEDESMHFEMTSKDIAVGAERVNAALRQFATTLHSKEVNIVLTSGQLPYSMLSECARMGMFVCDGIDKRDLTLLSDALSVPIVPPSDVLFNEIGSGDTVHVGKIECLNKGLVRVHDVNAVQCSIILSAPSAGLVSDYAELVDRCIRCVQFTVSSSDKVPVVGSAGKDILIAAKAVKGIEPSVLSTALADALQGVVVCLLTNTLGSKHQATHTMLKASDLGQGAVSTMHVLHKLQEAPSHCEVLPPEDVGLVHPPQAASHLVASVLDTLAFLSKIDMLAPCKALAQGSSHVRQEGLV